MFDLEKSIAEWRRRMLTAGIKTPVPLEELEIHLREDIERQVKSGMNRQEAFGVAIRQMGQAAALRKEFEKLGGVMTARQRQFYFGFFGLATILLGLTGLVILFIPFGALPRMAFHEQLLGACGFISVALILWSWRFTWDFFPVLSRRMRLMVALLCIVLSGRSVALVLHIVLSSVTSVDQILAGTAWPTLPLALAASIIFGLEEAAYRKTANV